MQKLIQHPIERLKSWRLKYLEKSQSKFKNFTFIKFVKVLLFTILNLILQIVSSLILVGLFGFIYLFEDWKSGTKAIQFLAAIHEPCKVYVNFFDDLEQKIKEKMNPKFSMKNFDHLSQKEKQYYSSLFKALIDENLKYNRQLKEKKHLSKNIDSQS